MYLRCTWVHSLGVQGSKRSQLSQQQRQNMLQPLYHLVKQCGLEDYLMISVKSMMLQLKFYVIIDLLTISITKKSSYARVNETYGYQISIYKESSSRWSDKPWNTTIMSNGKTSSRNLFQFKNIFIAYQCQAFATFNQGEC